MNLFLWIVSGLLGAIFLASGVMKLTRTQGELAASGQRWAEDFNAPVIKALGVLEVLAAIALVLPPIVGVATVLVPLAALGLILLMLGAAVTHLRRRERLPVVVNIAFLALAGVVLWGRLVPEPFLG